MQKEKKMAVSYKRLWKILIDRDMKKKDLAELADLSIYAFVKTYEVKNITAAPM